MTRAVVEVPTGGWSLVVCVSVDAQPGAGAVTVTTGTQTPIEWTADDLRAVLGADEQEPTP